jgi:hypothetical protein
VQSSDEDLIGWTRWKKFRITVQFGQPQHELLADEQIYGSGATAPYESKRYVVPEYKGDIEVLSLGQGNLVFSADPDGVTGVAGKRSFSAESIAITPKSTITLNWLQVPMAFISPDGGFTFPHTKHVGKVNSGSSLFGFPAGSLQMLPMQVRRYKTHVFQYDLVASVQRFVPIVLADVTFTFAQFEPESAITGQTAGFNWWPWRGDQPGMDGVRYLPATRSGATGGGKVFKTYDFIKLFNHHSAV